MLGLSRRERQAAVLLPGLVLGSALLLIAVTAAWHLTRPGVMRCWVPQEFTPEWAAYANEVCSSRAANLYLAPTENVVPQRMKKRPRPITATVAMPTEWASLIPAKLFAVFLLLLAPWLIGDLVRRLAEAVAPSDRPLTAVGSVVRGGGMLVTRVALASCLVATAAFVFRSRGPVLWLGRVSGPDTAAAGGLFNWRGAVNVLDTPPETVLCDFRVGKLLGRSASYTLQCAVRYGPQVLLAQALLFLAWTSAVAAAVWVVVGTVELLILAVIPATRAAVLQPGPAPGEGRRGQKGDSDGDGLTDTKM